MSTPIARSAGAVLFKGLASRKCLLIGWMISWAAFTYASAALRWLQTGGMNAAGDLRRTSGAIFAVADHVPPHAKILFGTVFLLLLLVLPGTLRSGRHAAMGMAAGTIAATVSLCVAPFDYFAGGRGSFLLNLGVTATAPHVLIGLGAGLAWAFAAPDASASRR
jgi:hypothetical protein